MSPDVIVRFKKYPHIPVRAVRSRDCGSGVVPPRPCAFLRECDGIPCVSASGDDSVRWEEVPDEQV